MRNKFLKLRWFGRTTDQMHGNIVAHGNVLPGDPRMSIYHSVICHWIWRHWYNVYINHVTSSHNSHICPLCIFNIYKNNYVSSYNYDNDCIRYMKVLPSFGPMAHINSFHPSLQRFKLIPPALK